MHGRIGSNLLLITFALCLGGRAAYAQATADFATCGTSPLACSATSSTCCTTTFPIVGANKPLIIPLDRCHQPGANSGDLSAPLVGPPGSANNSNWCSESPNPNAKGMFHAYGLVYRLMQRGIPVYWIVNPAKTAPTVTKFQTPTGSQIHTHKDVDLWVLSAGASPPAAGGSLTACLAAAPCTPPVTRLNRDLAPATTAPAAYLKKEFPLRGSVFMIAAEDRAAFNTFWNLGSKTGATGLSGRTCGNAGNDCYDFSNVRLYEVNTGASFAWIDYSSNTQHNNVPVAVKIDYPPPRIARLNTTNAVATSWLEAANLKDQATNASCTTGAFVPSEAVFCNVDEAEILSNKLVSGGFTWAWIDGKTFTDCAPGLIKVKAFLTGVPASWSAGHVMFNESAVQQAEECANQQILGSAGAVTASLSANNTAINETNSAPLVIRYPTSLFSQWGDIPMDFASGAISNWNTSASRTYASVFTGAGNTLRRLVSQESAGNPLCGDTNANNSISDAGEIPHSPPTSACDPDGYDVTIANYRRATRDNVDMATYGRFQNTVINGIAFYTPGNQISNKPAELRLVLNSLLATPSGKYTNTPTSTIEISRSSPVVHSIDGTTAVVQGSYVYEDFNGIPAKSVTQVNSNTDIGSFTFPYRTGHMRAIDISGTTLFDAANGVSGTRTIYTSVTKVRTSAGQVPMIAFTTANVGTKGDGGLGDLIATTAPNLTDATRSSIVTTVRGGALGGVDRSTVAVVQASGFAGSSVRPTMVYFGASDGMLHAVCATVAAAFGCNSIGQELWAYIPRTVLPFLRKNEQRIDGSPRPVDVKGDFDNDGDEEYRTFVMFQTGMGNANSQATVGAVYGMDVTDPANPVLRWEYSQDVATRGTYELGVGLTLAAGQILVSAGVTKSVAWAETTNGGTGEAGVVVTAIDIEDGSEVWANPFGYTYPGLVDPGGSCAAASDGTACTAATNGTGTCSKGYCQTGPRTTTNDVVPDSAIPGGAVIVSQDGTAFVTDVVFNDIYGNLWIINPLTGVSKTSSAATPLYSAASDYRPFGAKPAIFSTGGTQYAVFATGGYADPSNTSWPMQCARSSDGLDVCAQFNNSTTALPIQYAIAVALNATAVTAAPIAEPAACGASPLTACPANIRFKRNLAVNEKSYSQALVVGDEIFFAFSRENVNRFAFGTAGFNTGVAYSFDVGGALTASTDQNSDGARDTIVVGAGSFGANGQNLYRGGGTAHGSFGTSLADPSTGTSVKPNVTASVSRKLWLRSE